MHSNQSANQMGHNCISVMHNASGFMTVNHTYPSGYTLVIRRFTVINHNNNLSLTDTYRIAGIFRGYKCSRFSRIEPLPRKFIPTKIYNFIE